MFRYNAETPMPPFSLSSILAEAKAARRKAFLLSGSSNPSGSSNYFVLLMYRRAVLSWCRGLRVLGLPSTLQKICPNEPCLAASTRMVPLPSPQAHCIDKTSLFANYCRTTVLFCAVAQTAVIDVTTRRPQWHADVMWPCHHLALIVACTLGRTFTDKSLTTLAHRSAASLECTIQILFRTLVKKHCQLAPISATIRPILRWVDAYFSCTLDMCRSIRSLTQGSLCTSILLLAGTLHSQNTSLNISVHTMECVKTSLVASLRSTIIKADGVIDRFVDMILRKHARQQTLVSAELSSVINGLKFWSSSQVANDSLHFALLLFSLISRGCSYENHSLGIASGTLLNAQRTIEIMRQQNWSLGDVFDDVRVKRTLRGACLRIIQLSTNQPSTLEAVSLFRENWTKIWWLLRESKPMTSYFSESFGSLLVMLRLSLRDHSLYRILWQTTVILSCRFATSHLRITLRWLRQLRAICSRISFHPAKSILD